jgi:hypothetical protein
MCNLCENPEEARKDHLIDAADLLKLAEKYRKVASGKILPHTKEMSDIGPLARRVIRLLTHDWV